MVQAIEDARRRERTGSARIPPHNLHAEESLLGAMLLSRDAIAAAVETCAADDLYKPAHGHVFDAITTLYSRGEPADPVTVADELSRAGLLEAGRRPGQAHLAAGGHAGDHQRRPLRPHRGGARPPAPPDRGRRRDRRARLQRARRRGRRRRPGRSAGLRRRRTPGDRQPQAASEPAGGHPRPPRTPLRPGRGHHRRADRLHRPRRTAVRAAAFHPHHRGRPARPSARRPSPWAWPPTRPWRRGSRRWSSPWRCPTRS